MSPNVINPGSVGGFGAMQLPNITLGLPVETSLVPVFQTCWKVGEKVVENGSLDEDVTCLCGAADRGNGGDWRNPTDGEACMHGCHGRTMKHSLELGGPRRQGHAPPPLLDFVTGVVAVAAQTLGPAFISLSTWAHEVFQT